MTHNYYHHSESSCFRITTIYPEFYFHVQVAKFPRANKRNALRKALRLLATQAVAKFYPTVHVEIRVELEGGSLKAWITVKRATALAILTAFLNYGEIRQSFDYAMQDIGRVLTFIRNGLEPTLHPYGLRETIRTERRKGAIARLDELINAYQNQQISHVQYLAEATAVLKKIAESEDRKDVIPALRKYIDAHYGDNFRWGHLAQLVASTSDEHSKHPHGPQSLPKHPRPDAALSNDDKRRKRKRN
ncbi:hypothetical protein B7486_07710 [cyanobacterium TDX16]|nr:hypothetical protein B7486_07710 [cyanobacterium TDX16]